MLDGEQGFVADVAGLIRYGLYEQSERGRRRLLLLPFKSSFLHLVWQGAMRYLVQLQGSNVPNCAEVVCGKSLARHQVFVGLNWHHRPFAVK